MSRLRVDKSASIDVSHVCRRFGVSKQPYYKRREVKEPHRSYPRNKSIAQVLYLTAYLERWGTGVERIVQICKEYGVPEPEWTATAHDVTVTFWRKSKEDGAQNGGNFGENGGNSVGNLNDIQLTERQQAIYNIIKKKRTCNRQIIVGNFVGNYTHHRARY